MKSFTLVTIAVALLVSTVNAFWRMPCRGRTDLARIDPIVDFGEVSAHAHTLHGGSSKYTFVFPFSVRGYCQYPGLHAREVILDTVKNSGLGDPGWI